MALNVIASRSISNKKFHDPTDWAVEYTKNKLKHR